MQRLKFAVGLMSLVIVTVLSGLVLAATAMPLLSGGNRVVLTSGSMTPLIKPGDLVLTTKADHPLDPGTVVVFKNPNKPGSLITHRIIENLPDGRYRTKGDANGQPDISPVEQENVVGRGSLLIPVIGLPVIWARQGYAVLAGAAAVVVLLLVFFTRYGLLNKYDPWLNSPAPVVPPERVDNAKEKIQPPSAAPSADALSGHGPCLAPVIDGPGAGAQQSHQKRGAKTAALAVTALLTIAVAGPATAPQPSAAAFTAHTASSGNLLRVPCAGRTVTATADTYVDQRHTSTVGSSTELRVLSHAQDQRTFLQFPVSAISTGCKVVAANLRLYSTSYTAGRTIEAVQVTGPWSEATTHWGNQPATVAPAATSSSGPGWRDWTVTEQALAMLPSGTVNLMLRDSVEDKGTNNSQVYSSREGANPPQLVLTLG